MDLASQGAGPLDERGRTRLDDRGYIMAVLLIAMAVTAIWMSATIPSWRQRAVRERELELVFRGEQCARAIALYYRKNNNTFPPSVDVLVSQHYLRKKYKDPITGTDFYYVGGVNPATGLGGRGQATFAPPTTAQAGITGCRSTSQATSIRVYKNQQTYAMWAFDGTTMLQQMGYGQGNQNPGGAGPGRGAPGTNTPRGGPGTNPIGGGPGGAAPGRGGPGGLQPPGGGRGRGESYQSS